MTDILVADLVPITERGAFQGLLGIVWSFACGIGPIIVSNTLTDYRSILTRIHRAVPCLRKRLGVGCSVCYTHTHMAFSHPNGTRRHQSPCCRSRVRSSVDVLERTHSGRIHYCQSRPCRLGVCNSALSQASLELLTMI